MNDSLGVSMLKTLLLLSLLISFCVAFSRPSLAQTSSTQKPTTTARQPQPRVEKAKWSEPLETMYGISREDFAAMGLPKLTADEYFRVLGWAHQLESKAEEKGKEEGKEAIQSTQSTYSCGPKIVDSSAVSKVHVFVDAGTREQPSEVMSGLRERLRSISDIEIVYDIKEADLIVSVLAYENKAASRSIGYTASVASSTRCTGKLGASEWEFRIIGDHLLQTAGDVKVLVEGIVTDIDSRDIEEIRKSHALMKKYLPEPKK